MMDTTTTMEPLDRTRSAIGHTSEHPITGTPANVCEIDPLADSRWEKLVALHPRSSIFHTRAWLEALRATYGYRPVAYATTRGTRLEEAVVFCRIDSWLTGRRLVSLPFCDHCQPLASGRALDAILVHVREQERKTDLRYVELRPVTCNTQQAAGAGFEVSERFSLHAIDLTAELPVLFNRMHNTSVRQMINRAEREGLTYEVGRSEELLQKFRGLLFLTRRRHRVPPQPAAWFRNLATMLGDRMRLHVASKDGVPAASILTLHFGQQIIYKYGCSDPRFNNLGGTPALIWRVIQQAKEEGATSLDLGRSDLSNPGLIAFKQRLGGQAMELCYYRTPGTVERTPEAGSARDWAATLLARMPDSIFGAAGALLYRHVG